MTGHGRPAAYLAIRFAAAVDGVTSRMFAER